MPLSAAALRPERTEWPVRLGIGAVLGACIYPLALCGIHTHLMKVGVAQIGLTEALLLIMGLPLMARQFRPGLALLSALVAASQIGLWLLRGEVDPKALRDIFIPLGFLWMGMNLADPPAADRVLRLVALIALALGLVEWLFLDAYTQAFNILAYYVNQQNGVSAANSPIVGQVLSLNGFRPEGMGRTLLPGLLGNHRISSVFIEPVALGNFATLLAAWGLAKGPEQRGAALGFLGLALACMVLADSRFALLSIGLLACLRLCLPAAWSKVVIVFPLLAVLIMLSLNSALAESLPGRYGDSFLGRLLYSGSLLAHAELPVLFGLDGWSLRYGDAGYSYVFTRLGLPMVLLLWFGLWRLSMRDVAAERFRAYVGVYITLILTVSGSSLFAMKTSALLWFLIGVCAAYSMEKRRAGMYSCPPARNWFPGKGGIHASRPCRSPISSLSRRY